MLGLVAGELVVVYLIWSGHDPYLGLNAGFVGLAVNAAVTIAAIAALHAARRQMLNVEN